MEARPGSRKRGTRRQVSHDARTCARTFARPAPHGRRSGRPLERPRVVGSPGDAGGADASRSARTLPPVRLARRRRVARRAVRGPVAKAQAEGERMTSLEQESSTGRNAGAARARRGASRFTEANPPGARPGRPPSITDAAATHLLRRLLPPGAQGPRMRGCFDWPEAILTPWYVARAAGPVGQSSRSAAPCAERRSHA
jgi:hypothetical protein